MKKVSKAMVKELPSKKPTDLKAKKPKKKSMSKMSMYKI